jgi:hypothetical protein
MLCQTSWLKFGLVAIAHFDIRNRFEHVAAETRIHALPGTKSILVATSRNTHEGGELSRLAEFGQAARLTTDI